MLRVRLRDSCMSASIGFFNWVPDGSQIHTLGIRRSCRMCITALRSLHTICAGCTTLLRWLLRRRLKLLHWWLPCSFDRYTSGCDWNSSCLATDNGLRVSHSPGRPSPPPRSSGYASSPSGLCAVRPQCHCNPSSSVANHAGAYYRCFAAYCAPDHNSMLRASWVQMEVLGQAANHLVLHIVSKTHRTKCSVPNVLLSRAGTGSDVPVGLPQWSTRIPVSPTNAYHIHPSRLQWHHMSGSAYKTACQIAWYQGHTTMLAKSRKTIPCSLGGPIPAKTYHMHSIGAHPLEMPVPPWMHRWGSKDTGRWLETKIPQTDIESVGG